MDEEIRTQFQVKNLTILKNKMQLDIRNSMDTLTLGLKNLLDFEVESAKTKVLNIYQDVDAKIKDGDQDEILVLLGEKYLEETKSYLNKKRKDLLKCVESISSLDSLDSYKTSITDTFTDFDIFLKDKLVTYIEEDLMKQVRKLSTKVVSKEKRDFVNDRMAVFLKEHFVRRLVDKTQEQMQMRNRSLINNACDNYEHFSNLPTNC